MLERFADAIVFSNKTQSQTIARGHADSRVIKLGVQYFVSAARGGLYV